MRFVILALFVQLNQLPPWVSSCSPIAAHTTPPHNRQGRWNSLESSKFNLHNDNGILHNVSKCLKRNLQSGMSHFSRCRRWGNFGLSGKRITLPTPLPVPTLRYHAVSNPPCWARDMMGHNVEVASAILLFRLRIPGDISPGVTEFNWWYQSFLMGRASRG